MDEEIKEPDFENAPRRESKSVNLHLTVTPSLNEKARLFCKKRGMSFNELVATALIDYMEKEEKK